MKPSEPSVVNHKIIKTEEEVVEFLTCIQNRIKDSPESLIIIKRTNSIDKTFKFMVEYGLTHEYICQQIMDLNITNYCYTDFERNPRFNGEVWVFGQMFMENIPFIEIYIKLKLKNKIICLSFHPKEFDLQYPYN